MRTIYAILLLLFVYPALSSAQIEQIPLESNPILLQKTIELQKKKDRKMQSYFLEMGTGFRGAGINCNNLEILESYDESSSLSILSGDDLLLCIDTFQFIGLAGFGSITCLNCNTPSFGVATFNDGLCILYESNPGLIAETEIIEVELCDGDLNCDTLVFDIHIRRENQSITESLHLVDAEQDLTICVSTSNYDLPGAIESSSFQDCNIPLLGTPHNINNLDSCFVYSANGFAEMDTVCFEICDENCICDTYTFPIQIIGDTLQLPFMDDFSYDGPYPSESFWLDRRVFVNNKIANNPPSVGFATFDGINEKGTPYGGGYGRGDELTSNYLDLSNPPNDVYLSFYYQRKGLGFPPTGGDSLVLEFKNDIGDWITIDTFDGFVPAIPIDSVPPDFTFAAYSIEDSEYLYNGFQFRFSNYCIRQGIRDLWHVDYVRVGTNEIPDGSFSDVAFTEAPDPILKRYTSMPWWQFDDFVEEELGESYETTLYSHFDVINDIQGPSVHLIELQTATTFTNFPLLDAAESNIPPQEHVSFSKSISSNVLTDYINSMENDFSGNTFLEFDMEYAYLGTEQNGDFPATAQNDTVHYVTVFDNYFAYDDGTAENATSLTSPGNQIAIKYEVNKADSLQAIQIHFPHIFSNIEDQEFNLKIWINELDNDPEYVRFALNPIFPSSSFDTLNGFTTYQITNENGEAEALYLPAGDFYIGIQHTFGTPSSDQYMPIGYDLNNDASEHTFYSNENTWVPVTTKGALMIRPVVGNFTPGNTAIEYTDSETEKITLYPNPANNILNINLPNEDFENYDMTLFNSTGQLLQQGKLTKQIQISDLQNGMYYLSLFNQNTNHRSSYKFIVIK